MKSSREGPQKGREPEHSRQWRGGTGSMGGCVSAVQAGRPVGGRLGAGRGQDQLVSVREDFSSREAMGWRYLEGQPGQPPVWSSGSCLMLSLQS